MSRVFLRDGVIPTEITWNATGIVAFVLACLLAAAALGWLMWPKPMPTVKPGSSVAVELPSAVSQAPTVEVPGTAQPATPTAPARPAFKALPKTPEVRKRTKLPPAMFDAPETFILATSTVPAAYTDTTVTGVLDRRTGELSLQAVAEPAPWLARAKQMELAIGYTLRHGIEAKARADLIRSKSLYGYAEARINQDEADAGVYIGARF